MRKKPEKKQRSSPAPRSPGRKDVLPPEVLLAVESATDKKAADVVVLDLTGICSFTDRFVICTGASRRQTQAISDNLSEKLAAAGLRPAHIEGHAEGTWILMDYVDFVVHVFTPETREFYDLERLWREGRRVERSI
jgi:ribosome-associated protein